MAINGFGLLQAVQQYCLKGAGKTISLNFLHFTMQEYLAALHVSTLPSEQKSILIKNTFWNHRFNFMWMMYVGIVGIQLAGLTDLVNFAKSDVKDHNMHVKKYLFLFQCYLEIKETNFMPKEITSIFSDGNIDLRGQTLLPHHIMSLTVFMMRSTTQWKSLNLNACCIGCNGMDILENFFTDFQERLITLKHISLRYNHLTSLGNTHFDQNQTIPDNNSGLLQSVESLDLSYNQFCDSGIAELFCALKFNKTLRTLNISLDNIIHTVGISDMTLSKSINNISDEGVKKLIESVEVNTTLQNLDISHNVISDDSTLAISDYLKINSTLCKLSLSCNKITDEGAKRLAEAIQVNKTLQELNISKNWVSKEGVMRIVEACTINRTLHKLVCTHNNLSKSGLAAINEYIKKENAVQIFVGSWNSLYTKNSQLTFKTIFQLSYLQQKVQSDDDNIDEELWFIDEITDPKNLREILQCCLDVQHVNLTNTMTDDQMLIFCDCLMNNSTLTELKLSSNEFTDEGAKRLAEAIKVNTTLQELNLSMNKITDEGTKRLAVAIQGNTTLQELNISKNWISKEGVMRIVEACTINRTLHKLVCTHNNLSKSGLAAINGYIRKENAVQIFVGSWNSLCIKHNRLAFKTTFQLSDLQQKVQSDDDNIDEELGFIDEITDPKYLREFLQCCLDVQHVNLTGTMTDDQVLIFCHCLMNNSTLTELNLSSNKFTDDGSRRLAEAIQVNTTLQELNISMNKITDEGAKRLAEAIQINTTLKELNISMNIITDEGAKILAEAIQVNITLQELNIASNEIFDEGAKGLAEAIKVNKKLQILNISSNRITDEGAKRLAEAIQVNITLQELNIASNEIVDDGAKGLAEAIK